MMELEIVETKECSYCYKYIDSRASRCPYCCSVLQVRKKYKRTSQIAAFVAVVMTLTSYAGWNHAFNQAEEISRKDDEILLLGSNAEKLAGTLEEAEKSLVEIRKQEPEMEVVEVRGVLDLRLVERLASCQSLITDRSCVPSAKKVR